MSKNKLKDAYKSLNVIKYTNVIKDTLIPLLDEFDGEYLTTLTPKTVFTIEEHYYNNLFMGWNIKADGVLLETKSTRKKAEKHLWKLIENIDGGGK